MHLIREWQKVQALNPVAVKMPDQPHVEQQLYNRFEGDLGGRQLSETIPQFIKRMPPLTASTFDGWIWIENPIVKGKGKNKERRMDLEGFQDVASQLLGQFSADRARTERENPGKVQSTITRKLGPFRDQLKEDILDTAVKYGVTSGKVS